MFTLRKITGDGIEMNFLLGKSYTLITKEKNRNEFEHARVMLQYQENEVYGFISEENGVLHGLFPKQQAYIMVNGNTVDSLHKYNHVSDGKILEPLPYSPI